MLVLLLLGFLGAHVQVSLIWNGCIAGKTIARHLVQEKLAACCNIIPGAPHSDSLAMLKDASK
jgi:hypothetical protein